jgi:rod shape-determining protein MreC
MFFGYVVAIGGVLLAVTLLALNRFYPNTFNGLRGLALDATSPVTSSGRGAVRVVGQGGAAVGDYFRAGATNDELRAQIKAMRTRILQARGL